jgi:hypothetical protein
MMSVIRQLRERWSVYRERKKRLNAARNANPDYHWHGDSGHGVG